VVHRKISASACLCLTVYPTGLLPLGDSKEGPKGVSLRQTGAASEAGAFATSGTLPESFFLADPGNWGGGREDFSRQVGEAK